MNEIYKRQETFGLDTGHHVCIVGCGGVGFWTTVFLAMAGVKKFMLIDPDTLEESNLNRLPVTLLDAGEYKVDVLANFVRNIRPECEIKTFHTRVENVFYPEFEGVTIIVDNTDVTLVQKHTYTLAKNLGVTYIRGGYDGYFVTVHNFDPNAMLGPERTGYEADPSFVVPAVIAGAFTAMKVLNKGWRNVYVMFDLNSFEFMKM